MKNNSTNHSSKLDTETSLVANVLNDIDFIEEIERITGLNFKDSPIVDDDTIVPIDLSTDPVLTWKLVDHKMEQFSFRFWHVEELINQANELLERCVRDRNSYDILREKAARLIIELWESRDQIEQFKSEQETLIRALPIEIAQLKADAHKIEYDWSSEAMAHYANLIDPDEIKFDPHINYAIDGMSKVEYGNWHRNIPDANTQEALGKFHYEITLRTTLSHMASLTAEIGRVAADRDASQRNVRLETARRAAAERSMQSRQTILSVKQYLARSRNALDFFSQVMALRNRFIGDFTDALARLRIAQQGMYRLYGYSSELPSISLDIVEVTRASDRHGFEDGTEDHFVCGGPLDRMSIWARSAARFLVGLSQQDQNYVRVISARRTVKLEKGLTWESLLSSNKDRIDFELSVGPEMFENQSGVRLRGLSVVIVPKAGKKAQGSWNCELVPPEIASYRNVMPGSDWADSVQQPAPTIFLGRLKCQDEHDNVDVVGLRSLHNLSPISSKFDDTERARWRVKVANLSSQGEKIATVAQDIEIHLVLAAVNKSE